MRRYIPLARHGSVLVRLALGASLAAGLAFTTLQAQIPGRNVNMVSGVTLPDGDPYLQRQNEPSIAASTRNPLHLLAGSNDYRSVDIPGLCVETDPVTGACAKYESEIGDAWLGVYRSTDGGERWKSTLLPGYPQEPAGDGLDPQGNKSPLKIGAYGAAADPVVRAGTNGLLYFAGLAFDRTENGKSAIFMARHIDNNNREDRDAIQYLGTSLVATAGADTGVFLDKPWMAVDIPRGGNPGTCRIVTPGDRNVSRDGIVTQDPPVVQNLPAGTVYVSYTAFSDHPSGERRSAIYLTRSFDCGASWQAPIKVSRDEDPSNQGSTISIDPRNGHIFVAWRRFSAASAPNRDGIMLAKLPAGGRKFNTPGLARRFPEGRKNGLNPERFERDAAKVVAEVSQFDQATTPWSFRTNAYPVMTIDGEGRVYLAWSERGFATARPSPISGDARVVLVSTTDGTTFTAPAPVDDVPQSTDSTTYTMLQGHQVMPSLTFAGGKLMLIYYDLRETKAQLFNRFIEDQSGGNTVLRHTIDIRSVLGTPGASPQFASSVKVSEYLRGFHASLGTGRQQLQFNPPNLPMFKLGTAPFMGDYIDVTAAPAFVPTGKGRWAFNTAASNTLPIFHAVWTDNRDVRAPRVDTNQDGNPWNDYTPVRVSSGQTGSTGKEQWINNPVCEAGNTGSRNQNIYTSRITGGLRVGSPGNAKPLSTAIQRGFVVFAQNDTSKTRTFQLTILNQPPGGRASFDQFPIPPYTSATPAPRTVLEVRVAARSTASRTVYLTSSDPNASVNVDIKEINYLAGEVPLDGRVILNPDIENPDIENPDIENPDLENPDIENPDIENAEVYNPDIENPDIENPDIENPDIENPDIENPDIENPDIENPDIENVVIANPDIENPDIANPDIENPDIENPDIENPDIENVAVGGDGVLTDITWDITNTGNTAAAFNVNLFLAQTTLPTGLKSQLILYKTYRTPVANTVNGTCVLAYETRKSIVANIPSPEFVTNQSGVPDQNDPSEKNATLWLGPGEAGKITLRVYDPDRSNNTTVQVEQQDGTFKPVSVDPAFVPSEDVTPVVQQQGVNTEDAQTGVTEPPVVPPPPPPATDDTIWTSPSTPVRVNVLGNDAALFGSTRIISSHPAGLAQNMGGGASELVYMPTTGLIYAGSGRAVGVIDPVSNHLVGRIPTNPADGAATYGIASPSSGLVFFRMGGNGNAGASLYAFDARPNSPTGTFNQVFPISPAASAAIDALGDAHTFTLDTTGKIVFYVAGTPTQQAVYALNADPASPTVGAILWGPMALPANGKAWQIAQNPASGKLYIASLNSGSGLPPGGGVYVMNPAAPAPPVKITGTDQAASLAINPATNLVFAAGANGGSIRVNAIDGATDTLISQLALAGSNVRTNNAEDRMVVHHATGRVFLRGANQVFVIDGLRFSPTFNQLKVTHAVAPDINNTDLTVDQSTGVVAVSGNFVFSLGVIDAATDGLTWLPALPRAGGELALDAATHRLFLADSLGTVHAYSALSAATVAWTSAIEVTPETTQVLVNTATNRAYAASSGLGSTITVLSGAGLGAPVANVAPQAGRWGFGGQYGSSFYFTNSASDPTGSFLRPGTLVKIDGNSDTAIMTVPTIGQPFGFGVNQAAGQLIVGGFNGVTSAGVFEAGKIRIHDAVNPAVFVDADISGVPANNSTSLSFGRHIVTNSATGNTYVMIMGGSPRSVVYLPPTVLPAAPVATALDLTALPGLGLTADDRVEVIRVNPAANLVYLGLSNGVTNTYRVLALNGNDHSLAASYTGGGHGRLHTASWIAINGAGDRLYVVNYNADTVTMLNATTLAVIATTSLPDGPSATAFNATLNRLYVSSIDAKTITAIDGSSLAVMSSVALPLHAFFLHPSESENRLYTAGGNSPDESGFMVLSDVGGQLGAAVNVTSATNGGGTTTVNADSSITYTPAPGFSGTDTFTYTAHTAAGDSEATVTVNVIPVAASPVAFSDAYSTPEGVVLNVGGRGVLDNDAVSNFATAVLGFTSGPGLTLNPNGSFQFVPAGPGLFQFTYVAFDGVNSNSATVSINVVAMPNPLVVTTTADSGTGSLRAAIDYANTTPGPQTITFAIPGVTPAAPAVINLQTALPIISGAVTIDATTQSGYEGRPVVELTNNGGGGIAVGLETDFDAQLVTIRGFAVTRFLTAGIRLLQADTAPPGTGHVVTANILGTDRNSASLKGNSTGIIVRRDGALVTGNVISGNTGPGVLIHTDADGVQIVNNTIGLANDKVVARPNAAGIRMSDSVDNAIIDSNLIAGNNGWGIDIQDSLPGDVTGTMIIANRIGLNQLGDSVPNSAGGIQINNAPGTQIGIAGNGNVISGNANAGFTSGGPGIRVLGSPAVVPTIRANRIGTDPTGQVARPNRFEGVVLYGRAEVGGMRSANEGNLISGNGNILTGGGTGMIIGLGANGSVVRGNTIGLTAGGAPLGNAYSGITVTGDVTSITIGGDDNDLVNTISGNPAAGITLYSVGGPKPYEIEIQGNSIYNNGGLGIDLENDGITGNDVGDGDTGANGQQNFPVLTSAVNNGAATQVNVDLSTLVAGYTYRVHFYASAACDGGGHGEGQTFIGLADIVQPGGSANLPPVPAGQVITATATDSDGNTSEFSACVQVAAGGPPDLVSAVGELSPAGVTFRVRFAPGTFNATTTLIDILMDTDENVATGHPGTDGSCTNDAAVLGADYIARAGAGAANVAPSPGCNTGGAPQPAALVTLPDGMDVTFPLSAIGGDDGLLRFKVVTYTRLSPISTTGIQDRLTGLGQPALVVP